MRVDLPWIGKYKLRLIGKNYDTGKAYKLCEYILLCTTPKFNAKANPENERDEWGPGAETARMGMDPVGLDGGVVIMEVPYIYLFTVICTGYERARYKGTQASHLYEKSMHTLCIISEQLLLAEASTILDRSLSQSVIMVSM